MNLTRRYSKDLMRLALTVVLMGGAAVLGPGVHAGKYNAVISVGDPMPEFNQLPNISGDALSSSDLKSDVVVIMSLANHCPWVKGMDADLVKLADSYQGKSVSFVGMSFNHREDDRLEAMKEHARKTGYSFDYVFDESQETGKALGAVRTPEYFVFNRDRKLIYTGLLYNSPAKMNRDGTVNYTRGEPTEFYVANAIDAALEGKIPEVSETQAHGCSVKYVQE